MSNAVDYNNLPQSTLVGEAGDPEGLAKLIETAMQGNPNFRYFDRALGGPRSCRLLFHEEIEGLTTTVPLPAPFGPKATAKELFMLCSVRYDPPNAPSPRARKGWEVRVSQVDEKNVVIVLAQWIMP